MPIFNANNNFQGSEQADLIGGLDGGDTLLGAAGDIVGGPSDDSLLGDSTRIGGPDDTTAITPGIITIAITPGIIWFSPGKPAPGETVRRLSESGELLSADQPSLGTSEYLTNDQSIPFAGGSNLIGFSFEPPTLGVGESNFIF
jgi:hypothetical protein